MKYLRHAFTEAAMDIRRITHDGHVMVRLDDMIGYLRGRKHGSNCYGAARELECLFFKDEPEEEDAA